MEEIMKMGAWSPEEDQKLKTYIMRFGIWNWNLMPKFAGLSRTGKSCRLRWMNYLRPDVKRGPFTIEERETVIKMYQELGNRWSAIAARLPGRTDNEVKNFFHTHLKKHLGVKNMNVSARRRKSVSKKTKSRKAHEKTPLLFLDNNPITSSCNNSLMLSPDVSSISTTSSSIITFDQNQKILENTVILESNPATTTHDQSLSIESLDEFDTNSFWLRLLNDAHRLIL